MRDDERLMAEHELNELLANDAAVICGEIHRHPNPWGIEVATFNRSATIGIGICA